MGAGGAAVVVLLGFIIWGIFGGAKKKDDGPTISLGGPGELSIPSISLPPPTPGSERAKLPEHVNKAIERGVEFLKKQIPNGPNMRTGALALLGLTLLECGLPADDPDVKTVADMVRTAQMRDPYDIAPTIFFLDRLNSTPTPEDKKLIRSLGLRLVASHAGAAFCGATELRRP